MSGRTDPEMQSLDLCRLFYDDVVQPVLGGAFPCTPHAAAVIGGGSEVLGFDDQISRDHDWGPHVTLFLDQKDHAQHGDAMREALSCAFPPAFHGYRVCVRPSGPVPHDCRCTDVLSPRGFLLAYLNFDIDDEIEGIDWLTFPEQKLRSIAAGAVFHDEIGLQAVQDRFAYYPRDVWFYLLAAGWCRIAQEEHLMGRAGSAGDEIGSAIMASRLVRDLMRLCFLMEKHYAPYTKWFGTAFMKLQCGIDLAPILRGIQLAQTWKDRERHFAAAWERAGALHNALGITPLVQVKVSSFHDRPYAVCNSGEFCEAIRAQIKDPGLSRLAFEGLFGGIDQVSDSTDILDNTRWRHALRRLYEMGSTGCS